MARRCALFFCGLVLEVTAATQSWPQWGGPQRNFMADAALALDLKR
jgi:hypothetical protein